MPHFAKYHALGNDYLIIDPQRVDLSPGGEVSRRLCDRHRGIGADGVLFGPLSPVDPSGVDLLIYNADGSECGRSGNGIRLFALYLVEHYLKETKFVVRTAAGESVVQILDFATGLVRIGMGRPSFDAAGVPLLGVSGPAVDIALAVDDTQLTVTALNNGNPHAVVLCDEVSPALAHELGLRVARHPRFPERTNVQFVRVADRSTLDIEIWERGAGYTLASGACACAAASVAHAKGLVDDHVTVRMPGGSLDIVIDDDGSVWMAGPVEPVAVGDFSPEFRVKLAAG
ncbi:MAG: diaminopimelate epimerase [Micromonosporaceae bacterium]